MTVLLGASTVAFCAASSRRPDTASMSRVKPLKIAIVCALPITSDIMIPLDASFVGGIMYSRSGNCSLDGFSMASKGRGSAAHARDRQKLAIGYTKSLIVVVRHAHRW